MKREELMEAIGCVEESLLVETEQSVQHPRRSLWRLALVPAVAAMLAISVAAATGLLSRPITDSEMVTEVTASPLAGVDGQKVAAGGVMNRVVCMEVEMNADAPQTVEWAYGVIPADDWKLLGTGYSIGKAQVTTVWERDVYEQVRLIQNTVELAEINYGKSGVDRLWSMPGDVRIASKIVTMAGLEMLRVDIPAEGMDVLINAGGETRLYWADGEYYLRLDCPSWMSNDDIESLLNTLYIKTNIDDKPEK